MSSFCHGVQIFPQPLPKRNPGGDCFACALTAAMRFFFPDRAPSFDQCWEAFQREETRGDTGEKWTSLRNIWPGMRDALYAMSGAGWKMEILADVVAPRVEDPECYSYNWGPKVDEYEYARRLEGWLRCGYLAFADLMYAPCETGEWAVRDGRRHRNTNDHFVLLDGVRGGWRKHEVVEGASTLVYQVHVVCSAAGGRAYWIDVEDLLHQHGASSSWWLARTDSRETLPAD